MDLRRLGTGAGPGRPGAQRHRGDAEHHRAQGRGTGHRPGPGRRRGRQPRQERVPGQYEPRDPHPPERGDGGGRRPRAHGAEERSAGYGAVDRDLGPDPGEPAVGRAGPGADRGRAAGLEGGGLRYRRRGDPGHRPLRPHGGGQGPGLRRGDRRRGAGRLRRGRGPGAADPVEHDLQCGEVHHRGVGAGERWGRGG